MYLALVKTGPTNVVERGQIRHMDPLQATTMHQRMTFLRETLVTRSWR